MTADSGCTSPLVSPHRLLLRAAVLALIATPPSPRPAAAQTQSHATITVFAAASLKDVFQALGSRFERDNPGSRVRFAFAGTQELRMQLEHGARADVFAAADTKHTSALAKAGLIDPPVRFASNRLALIVPAANPASLHRFADLSRGKRLVIGAEAVPVGHYSAAVIDRAASTLGRQFRVNVLQRVVSRELNVKQIVTKVVLGEADAGLVYETDARAAGDKVRAIAIPPAWNVTADYPIAVVRQSAQPNLAAAFVRLVLSEAGQKELRAAGFISPNPRGVDAGAAR